MYNLKGSWLWITKKIQSLIKNKKRRFGLLTLIFCKYSSRNCDIWPWSRSTNRNFLKPYLRRLREMQNREMAATRDWETRISSSKLLTWYFSQSEQWERWITKNGSATPRRRNETHERVRLKKEYWQKPNILRKVSKRWREWSSMVSFSSSCWCEPIISGVWAE